MSSTRADGPVSRNEAPARYPVAGRPGGKNRGFARDAAGRHHGGYRDRQRRRLCDSGAEQLPDDELLAMILFAAGPRVDTKPLAKAMLAHCGGFAKALSASPDVLAEAGLNLAGIAAVKSVPAVAKRLMRTALRDLPVVNSWDKLIDYCDGHIARGAAEEFHILFLDRKNVLLKHEQQAKRAIDPAADHPRAVVKRALELGAAALILVQNRRSSDLRPSRADVALTQAMRKTAAPLGITVHDHVLLGRNGAAGLRDCGLLGDRGRQMDGARPTGINDGMDAASRAGGR